MKHPLTVTLLLVFLFVAAQATGLFLVERSIIAVTVANGVPTLERSETALGERPALSGYQSVIYLVSAIAIGTALLLLLIRFRKIKLWKAWFFLAVFAAQAMAFGVLLPQLLALLLALLLAALKIYKPNPWIHNLTEILMYAGIAVFLVPILDVSWAIVLLLTISLYDVWAVWRSKHMVAMAEFQKSSEVFAGLMIPKREESIPSAPTAATPLAASPGMSRSKAPPTRSAPLIAPTTASVTTTAAKKGAAAHPPLPPPRRGHAILGGGDIAFPLLFTGAFLEWLILSGVPRGAAYAESLLVTLGATLALFALFWFAKKDHYYPAMPFLTAGCLVGWLATLLV